MLVSFPRSSWSVKLGGSAANWARCSVVVYLFLRFSFRFFCFWICCDREGSSETASDWGGTEGWVSNSIFFGVANWAARASFCVCASSAEPKEQLSFPGVGERLQQASFSFSSVWFQSPGAHRRVRGAQASFLFLSFFLFRVMLVSAPRMSIFVGVLQAMKQLGTVEYWSRRMLSSISFLVGAVSWSELQRGGLSCGWVAFGLVAEKRGVFFCFVRSVSCWATRRTRWLRCNGEPKVGVLSMYCYWSWSRATRKLQGLGGLPRSCWRRLQRPAIGRVKGSSAWFHFILQCVDAELAKPRSKGLTGKNSHPSLSFGGSLLHGAAICKSKDITNKHKIQTIIEHHKNENEGNIPHEGSP